MKNLLLSNVLLLSMLILNGCGGAGGGANQTFYITDVFGDGVPGIEYDCDSGTSGETGALGAFVSGATQDNCLMDLRVNLIVGDIYLEDGNGALAAIDFDCAGNGNVGFLNLAGNTLADGFIVDATDYITCDLLNLP